MQPDLLATFRRVGAQAVNRAFHNVHDWQGVQEQADFLRTENSVQKRTTLATNMMTYQQEPP